MEDPQYHLLKTCRIGFFNGLFGLYHLLYIHKASTIVSKCVKYFVLTTLAKPRCCCTSLTKIAILCYRTHQVFLPLYLVNPSIDCCNS